jgi:transcriptional regulator
MGNETARRLTAAEKRSEALALRIAGMSYEEIATTLGWANKSVAWKAVQKGIADVPRENARELKTMQLETLNEAKLSIFAAVRRGDVQAIDRLIKVLDHEAKLEGLYEQKDDSGAEEVKAALLDFAAGIKDLVAADEPEHVDGVAADGAGDDAAA